MMRILKIVFFAFVGFVTARRLTRGSSSVEDAGGDAAASYRREITAPGGRASERRKFGARETAGTGRGELKTFLKRLAILVPVLALVGFLIAASGIIPLKASTGHWAVTEWFLNFSMERSIALHSTGIKVPPLDDPVLVLKGAGHYDFGCRPCHGGLQGESPRIPENMTPPPPHLPPQIERFKERELFYIVKHGEKFTGMPAWPAQTRDDEVWAVVAFLLRMPEMDIEEYVSLVEGPASGRKGARVTAHVPEQSMTPDTGVAADTSGDAKAAASAPVEGLVLPQGLSAGAEVPGAVSDRCGRCHGLKGEGREVGSFPRLAGQSPQYIFASLKAYAQGERHSGIMQPIAAGLSGEEMQEIALYYSRLRAGTPSQPPANAVAGERGERIAREGIPRRRVPSCIDCHGPGSTPRNPFYPRLAGQFAEYIELQLKLFKDEKRGGSAYARLMHPTADDLTEEQMRDLAVFYGSIAAESSD